jgi:hypothetical protein
MRKLSSAVAAPSFFVSPFTPADGQTSASPRSAEVERRVETLLRPAR